MIKLVTGGTGLIGSAFKTGIKVGSTDYDLVNDQMVSKMFFDHKPNVVVHTAAMVGGIGANLNYPADFFYKNILINTNVIQHAWLNGVEKLVCFLSTCVFPNNVDYPLDESKIHLGEPHFSNAPYAYSKRMADIQLQALNKQYGTKYFSVIPCNVYGLNDNYQLDNAHVIPALIHKCFLAKQNGTAFEVWGDGSARREFIFAEDVANIVDILIDTYNGINPIIISNPIEYSIKDVVDYIVKYMDFAGEVRWMTDKPQGQFRKPSSNARLRSIIGEYDFTALDVGLKRVVDWFVSAYPNIRH
jgi:GDP-L-fucose synthase